MPEIVWRTTACSVQGEEVVIPKQVVTCGISSVKGEAIYIHVLDGAARHLTPAMARHLATVLNDIADKYEERENTFGSWGK